MNCIIKRLSLFIFLCSHALTLHGQDSVSVFPIENFFTQILTYHPVVRQASLLDDKSKQEIRIARGLLDPTIASRYSNKEFSAKNYYSLWDNTLKIPTWYGVDVKAVFEKNVGPYVNDEERTPLQGLSYLGISVPIGQGLLIDERRSAIRQAQQLTLLAEAEKIKVINKLLLQAAKDYWDWMYCYNKFNLYTKGYELSSLRYQAVKERAIMGDLPTIDTLEAQLQVQNFEILVRQSLLELQNSSLIVSTYLWEDNNTPLELTGKAVPSWKGSEITPMSTDSLKMLVEVSKENHPDIIKLNAKSTQLRIEKRYIADKFKPKINLEYNLLQTGFPINNEILSDNFYANNYKFGVYASYPIFLRNERGKFQLTKLKIAETNLDIQQTNREVENNIIVIGNEWKALEDQIRLQEVMVKNAEALRSGEQIRFESGESSVFLINSREQYLINNQIKLSELRSKYAKVKTSLYWAAGTKNVNYLQNLNY